MTITESYLNIQSIRTILKIYSFLQQILNPANADTPQIIYRLNTFPASSINFWFVPSISKRHGRAFLRTDVYVMNIFPDAENC